jgi:hypothetical protein
MVQVTRAVRASRKNWLIARLCCHDSNLIALVHPSYWTLAHPGRGWA